MPLPKEHLYTIEDIYALPDGERAELIDGQIYYMAPPKRRHQRIVLNLSWKIADHIDSKGGSCEVNIAPFAVFLSEDDLNYVEPDISVVCDPKKLDDQGCKGAPDWVIEVVSPGTRRMDYGVKLFKYRTAGVREYWIVDPASRTVSVYTLEDGAYHAAAVYAGVAYTAGYFSRITVWNFQNDDTNEYSFSESVESCIFPGLYLETVF